MRRGSAWPPSRSTAADVGLPCGCSALVGATPPADDLDRLDALAAGELAGPVAGRGRPLRAFVPIWKRPWMTLSGGTYGSSLLAAVGVHNVYADAADRYPTVTLEEVRVRRPDVVLAPSEPYPFGARHVPLFEDVAPVVLVDGRDLFWWGARTPAALRRLADRLAGIDPRG